MRRFSGVFVMAVAVPGIVISGCGSGAKQDSPFRGAYRSVYTIPALNETGDFSFSVEQKGAMTGSFVDRSSGKTMGFQGSIDPKGTFTGNVTDAGTQYPISGTFSNTATGSVQGGDFRQTRNSVEYRGSYSLTSEPVQAPVDNAFAGSYNGTFATAGNAQNGVASFSVDRRGGIVGSLARGSETGQFTGTVRADGTFTGNVAFPSGAATLSGTLSPTTDGSPRGNFTLTGGGQTSAGSFGPPAALPAGNSFVGSYRGAFSVPNLRWSGPVSYTVNPAGNITGSFTRTDDTGNNEAGQFTGIVTADGALTGTVAFPTSGTVAINGTLVANTTGQPQGDFVLTRNGVADTGSFSGAIQTPTENGFQGAYRGTYSVPQLTEAGSISFTIDPTGNLQGFFEQQNNNPVGQMINGRITNDGSFTAQIVYPDGTADPYKSPRKIQGRIARTTVAGGTGLAGDFTQEVTVNGQTRTVTGNCELSIGSAEPDSNYRAAYTDGSLFTGLRGNPAFVFNGQTGVPANFTAAADNVNFNVDKQGIIVGTFGPHRVDGRVTNDGRLAGTLTGSDNRPYVIRGIVNKLTWKFDQDYPGIAGDLLLTGSNGTEYAFSIKATGGDGETRSRKRR